MKRGISTKERAAARTPLSMTVTFMAMLALCVSLALAGCAQQAEPAADTGGDLMTVSLKIDATDNGDGILYDGTVDIPVEGNVYDALVATGLDLVTSTSLGMGVYVDGIGPAIASKVSSLAGWMYDVNGERASVSCDAYVLKEGDEVVWTFYQDSISAMQQ